MLPTRCPHRLVVQYEKDVAQVLVRWSLQRGYADILSQSDNHCGLLGLICSYSPLPKSSQPARVVSNADLYDFELAAEDMAKLDALDLGSRGAISWNPVDVE